MSKVFNKVTRRNAVGLLGLAGAGAIGSAVVPAVRTEALSAAAAPAHDHMDTVTTLAQDDGPTNDEMDAMHEAGVKAFPAKTEGLGGQPMEFTMDGDVKVFDVVCQVVDWEVTPGTKVEAWTYNGVTPGPEIRVTEGDKIRVTYHCLYFVLRKSARHCTWAMRCAWST